MLYCGFDYKFPLLLFIHGFLYYVFNYVYFEKNIKLIFLIFSDDFDVLILKIKKIF
jgi:hypothetical protein